MSGSVTRIVARVGALSDDALRSEFVSASHPWAECEFISVVTRAACRVEARRRGIQLRDRAETIRVLLADMKGF